MSLLDEEDLAENNATRVPVVFCLDTSGSMEGTPIKKLNQAVRECYDALLNDRRAKYAADVCVVVFHNEAEVYREFENVSHNNVPQVKSLNAATELGAGVQLSLDCLEQRIAAYRANGLQCHPPMLIVMTDGIPVERDPSSTPRAASRATKLEASGDLIVIPFFVGNTRNEAAIQTIGSFSKVNDALSVKPSELSGLFQWISSKIIASSHAKVGSALDARLQEYLDQMIGQSGIDGLFK